MFSLRLQFIINITSLLRFQVGNHNIVSVLMTLLSVVRLRAALSPRGGFFFRRFGLIALPLLSSESTAVMRTFITLASMAAIEHFPKVRGSL